MGKAHTFHLKAEWKAAQLAAQAPDSYSEVMWASSPGAGFVQKTTTIPRYAANWEDW